MKLSARTLAAFTLLTLSVLPMAAQARVFVGVGVGVGGGYYAPAPAYYYQPYYDQPYYGSYYAPYYSPYAPPPAAAAPAPAPVADSSNGNCRDYTRTVTIDGQKQKAHGTACKQPDGTWKIVN